MFSNYIVNTPQVNCNLTESNLTELIPTCDDLLETNYIEIPGSSISDSQTRPLEFVYKGSPSVYVDLNNSQVYLDCLMVDASGTPVKPTDETVGVINHLGMFPLVFTLLV